MRWFKAVFLKIFLWYQNKIMKKSCAELVKKALVQLTPDEEATVKFLCKSRTTYYDIIELINGARLVDKLTGLIKQKFPNLSDEEVEKIVDEHAVNFKSNSKSAKKIFTEIQKSLDLAKSKIETPGK